MYIIEWKSDYIAWEMANRNVYATEKLAEKGIERLKKVFHAMEYRITRLEVVSE